jgi:hypothetical protein
VGDSFELSGLFDDILQLAPDTNHIAVVIGASPLERFWAKALRDAVEPFTNRVRVTWFNDLSFDETLRQVATLPPHSFILFGLLLRDAAGVTHNQDNVLQRLHAAANAPINGVFQNQLGRGIVGGRLNPAEAAGAASARIAIRILRGEPIAKFTPQAVPAWARGTTGASCSGGISARSACRPAARSTSGSRRSGGVIGGPSSAR